MDEAKGNDKVTGDKDSEMCPPQCLGDINGGGGVQNQPEDGIRRVGELGIKLMELQL